MTGTAIVTEIVSTLVSGITGVATGVGAGLSTLAESIFMTGTGDSQTISTFGILIVCFAGVSLALALCRWVVNFVTSLGNRNR